MNFEFVSAGGIVFGNGRAAEIPGLARGFGRRVLLVRGRAAGADGVAAALRAADFAVETLRGPSGEPDETDVDAAVPIARRMNADVLVAVGGGSVLDFAKAVAALAPQTPGPPVRDFLEGVGTGRTLTARPIPLIACPTTAGTGSEVTKNAVISSRAGRFKKSLRDARMVPVVAVVDPELQVGAPRDTRVWSGLDALTQNIEAAVSRKATPITEALAERGRVAAEAGLRHLADGREAESQEPLALAALLSGLALANGGLGAAHGIAQALGIYGVPHGLACAIALPWTLRRSGLADRVPPILDAFPLPRLADLPARWPDLPPLGSDDGIRVLAKASLGNSLSGNPIPLDEEDVAALLKQMRDV